MTAYNGETSQLSWLALSAEGPRTGGWTGEAVAVAPPGPAVIYRMRAYDTTLATIVYWDSGTPNTAEYGGPGPLTNLVISAIS